VTSLSARGILFDMDGTLVDSTVVVEGVWAEFASDYGLELRDVLAVSHGRRTADTVALLAPAGTNAEAVGLSIVDKERQRTEGVVEIPGAAAFANALPEELVGLVTSAPGDLAKIRMDAAGVHFPRVTVFGEDVANGKPAPDCYLLGARMLGLDPGDVLVFEDAPAGIAAALAAGMRTVVVGGYDGPEAQGLPRIADYTDVRATPSTDPDGTVRLTITLDSTADAEWSR